jgi:hypothetical protein
MQNISSYKDLKQAIDSLEIKQTDQLIQLKKQFDITLGYFHPANIFKTTLNEITKPKGLLPNLFGNVIGNLSKIFFN